MDTTKIEKLKFQVEQLNKLIASKAEATSELEKLAKINSDVRKAREALEALTVDEVNTAELQEYVQKEKENLAAINEYAGRFSQMNGEIALFDEFKATRVNEFLAVMTEQKRIVAEVKAAEKLSDKSKGPKVLIYSAEGRKKMIDADLAEDYQKLVEEKKKINKQVVSEYKKVNNIVTVKKEEIVKPIEIKVEVTVVQTAAPKVETEVVKTTEEPKFEIAEWETLTPAEKAKELVARKARIMEAAKKPGMGKKRLMEIDGKKVEMPVSLIGVYNSTSIELSGQRKIIEKASADNLQQAIAAADASRDRANARGETLTADNYMRRQIKMATPKDEIVEVRKPKKDMFRVVKDRVVAMVAAAVILTVMATGVMMSILNSMNEKYSADANYVSKVSDVINENKVETATTEVQKEAAAIVEQDAISRSEERTALTPEVKAEEKIETPTAELGDTITIKAGGRIFTTAEDAKNGTNEFSPYFGTEVEREVRGIYYTLKDGRTYLALSESENKPTQEQLQEAGAVKSSYLTGIKGGQPGYEGYFGIDSAITVAKEVENGRSR